jgi:hypothetical protein
MLYMLLICYDPTQPAPPGPASRQPEHARLEAELRERGAYVSGAALFPSEMGGRRVRDGRTMAPTDAPFAESREVVGGYYIVECATEDEAADIAARIPTDARSWVDVRRIALFHPDKGKIAAMP